MQGSYGVLKSMEKIWSFSSLETFFFGLLVWKQKIIFQTCIYGMHLHKHFVKYWFHFTSIVLTIIVPVFDLGMSFEKFKSGYLYSELRRNPENVVPP